MHYTVAICLDTNETEDWAMRHYALSTFGTREAAYTAATAYFDRLVAGNDECAIVSLTVKEDDGMYSELRSERGTFNG